MQSHTHQLHQYPQGYADHYPYSDDDDDDESAYAEEDYDHFDVDGHLHHTGHQYGMPNIQVHEEDDLSDFEDDDIDVDQDEFFADDMDRISSSPSIIDEDDIDLDFVYALHTFIASVEGQANVSKGDTMILLDDSNSYWWLVRVVRDGTIGYLPAEHIETPTERLARLNKHRNIDLAATMLSDSTPEKSKSAFRKIRRPKNRVQFIAPTYIEPSDVEWSSDEDDLVLEGDSSLVHDVEMEDDYYDDSYQDDELQDYQHYHKEPQELEEADEAEDQHREPEHHDMEIQGLGIQENAQPGNSMYSGAVQVHPDEFRDEDLTVKPLSPQSPRKEASVEQPPPPIEKDANKLAAKDSATAETTTSTSVPEGRKRSTSNLRARNTDSFYEDDTLETKKITLTPGLLRDDGTPFSSTTSPNPETIPSASASAPASAQASAPASASASKSASAPASNNVSPQADSDSVDKNLTPDEKPQHDSDKKKKEKKSGLISGLFKRKDKKNHHHHEEDKVASSESSSRLGTSLSRDSSANASKNSLVSSSSMASRDEEEKSGKKEKEDMVPPVDKKTSSEQRPRSRANSQTGSHSSYERPLHASNLSKALPERPNERSSAEPPKIASQPSSQPPSKPSSPVKSDPPSASMSEFNYISPSGVISSSSDTPIDQPSQTQQDAPSAGIALPESQISRPSTSHIDQGDVNSRAMSTLSEQQESPVRPDSSSRSRSIEPIQQTESLQPAVMGSPEADNFSRPRSPEKGRRESPVREREQSREPQPPSQVPSQVQISEAEGSLPEPEPTIPAPVAATESAAEPTKPPSSSSSSLAASQPAETPIPQQPPQPTWNDASLRAYLGDEPGSGGVRDLFIIVLNDKGNITPAGSDHPAMTTLYKEEHKVLKDMNNQLDELMCGWLGRKGIV